MVAEGVEVDSEVDHAVEDHLVQKVQEHSVDHRTVVVEVITTWENHSNHTTNAFSSKSLSFSFNLAAQVAVSRAMQ